MRILTRFIVFLLAGAISGCTDDPSSNSNSAGSSGFGDWVPIVSRDVLHPERAPTCYAQSRSTGDLIGFSAEHQDWAYLSHDISDLNSWRAAQELDWRRQCRSQEDLARLSEGRSGRRSSFSCNGYGGPMGQFDREISIHSSLDGEIRSVHVEFLRDELSGPGRILIIGGNEHSEMGVQSIVGNGGVILTFESRYNHSSSYGYSFLPNTFPLFRHFFYVPPGIDRAREYLRENCT